MYRELHTLLVPYRLRFSTTSGRLRFAGTSLHSLTEINMPDSALAIVLSLTWGLCGHVARSSVFMFFRVMLGRSSMSMTKSRISASSFGGLPPLGAAPSSMSPVSWYRRTIE